MISKSLKNSIQEMEDDQSILNSQI